jgi:hypothetical protein
MFWLALILGVSICLLLLTIIFGGYGLFILIGASIEKILHEIQINIPADHVKMLDELERINLQLSDIQSNTNISKPRQI